ncbi:glycosyltransferase involved in cell wall biosynthesis [Agromyces terreus]|uniref:Glycosyltransferase involved in cell wall biosynthesis n=1 Tax=Agromyces terreus TaxID=424795 RepID=A0A9X2H8A3_9MICO|nr:glycosyltransferase [Agromyces terreus]MCP2371324.1 glycosyltransferase involved in cell wall biosynthesis [Agromyces terreus]
MLKLQPLARGYRVEGSTDYAEAVAVLGSPDGPDVFHLHWPSPITERAANSGDAEGRTARFMDAIRSFRARGGRLVWTVHNVLPHDTKYSSTATRLHADLAAAADEVHVLTDATAAAVAATYALDEDRITVIPHSSYHGIYGARLPRAEAAEAVGADGDATTVLFFGQVRPYKGVEHLIAGLALADPEGARFQLLLAGNPAPAMRGTLDELERSATPVAKALRFIEDDEVASWFSAADVTVLPYQNVLNSGTMHLSATFGVPCILPGVHALTSPYGDQPWVRFFDVARPAESIAELLADGWYLEPSARESALAYARERLPAAMSLAYAELLDRVTG